MLDHALSFQGLQELTFEHESYYGPLQGFQPIHHNTLKYLRCSGLSLESLTLPALESLTVVDYGEYQVKDDYLGISWADNMTALIRRSKCRLTNLHILAACVVQEEHTYTELLPLVAPTLAVLEIAPHRYPEAEQIARSLTRTESSPGSLPYLKHLNVSPMNLAPQKCHNGADAFVDALATALISLCDRPLAERWHVSLLERVSINHRNDPMVVKMRMSGLESLRAHGLEVVYAPYNSIKPVEDAIVDWDTAWVDSNRR
ncbi:hypothetical protein CYLTODRAFT_483217 [Cylindrobasidium torrendii FP15055 ss-10]|uniref:F-box domain-containing protein n=1 Tax=Cylindrobasidium torrendii FP15055 ss-10 TaxID=1314674 RepID=A0A0D7AQX5_9AGAR|nr:hypothetical protein CYLTODRAFT_483217 [Cylindrobasidium torrendii FP15055 ss-10]